ncbi:MAG: hypothetical protein ACLURP_02255 [Ruminococcus sp.]
MEKQKVKDEIAARFGKKNWLVKALPIVYCVTGVLSYDRSTRVCG